MAPLSLARFASATDPTQRRSRAALATVLTSVLVLAAAMTWVYLGMRAVMDVGGTCATGGPYEIAQPCPSGAVLISVGIPLTLVAAMLGSAVATVLGAPNLLVPMWAALFGSLGWNFLEYGFSDGVVWGWVVCGVVFELMALPALAVMVLGRRLAAFVPERAIGVPGQAVWYVAYAVLALGGVALGWWSFDALS